jgi:hypothetical protein
MLCKFVLLVYECIDCSYANVGHCLQHANASVSIALLSVDMLTYLIHVETVFCLRNTEANYRCIFLPKSTGFSLQSILTVQEAAPRGSEPTLYHYTNYPGTVVTSNVHYISPCLLSVNWLSAPRL